MTYPQSTRSTLEAIYQHGKNICDEIEQFRPDVIIGLAHSGWMPVIVAQTLWAETRKMTFPASVRTNIGREKHEIYQAQYGKESLAFCCAECCSGPGRISHYLAWLAEQNTWLKTLRKQIHAAYPFTPNRILIVDDMLSSYRTAYTALALVEELYPGVTTYLLVGGNDLTDNFVTGWLEQHAPELGKEILTIEEKLARKTRYSSPWQETLKSLITGTEDVTPDSLDWKFISRESPSVKALAEYVPAKVALTAPDWAKSLACTYALQRLKGEVAGPKDDTDHQFRSTTLSLQPEERLAAKAWRQGGVMNTDIAQVYGSSLDQLKTGFRAVRMADEWYMHGQRPNAIYFPVNSFETWINAYLPPESNKPEFPLRGFAEFLPGEVWAGAYPISDRGMDVELFRDLLGTGINAFVNLTNTKDTYRKSPYLKTLAQVGREFHRNVEVETFPLPFRESPVKSQVDRVIKHIDRKLKAGQIIYVHAGYNLDGRTPLILACLLVKRGYSAKKALAKVNAFWMKTLHFLIRSPLSETQRQFILDWRKE